MKVSGQIIQLALLFLTLSLLGGACPVFDPNNPGASGFTMIFQDTFPGTALNASNWCPNYPSATGGCNADGPTTNTNQISSCNPTNVTVSGNAVHLKLQNVADNGYPTSGACINSVGNEHSGPTAPLQVFQPPAGATGAIWITATINIPDVGGDGTVRNEPSFWLNGVEPGTKICTTGWPNCDEIDIAEFYTGSLVGDCTSYHDLTNDWQDSSKTTCNARIPGSNGSFTGSHKYQLMWTNTAVTYYVDGVQLFKTTNINGGAEPYSHPMYLIFFNIADNRTTNVMPSTIDVSDVEVWSHS